MSAIELDAFEAFLDATGDADRELSAREVGLILRHLYDAGWRITRVPEPEQPHAAEPIARPHHAWPPAGLATKLWAIDMDPDRDQCMQIESIFELMRVTERGASLIAADSSTDARVYWKNRNPNDRGDAEFTVNGVTYQYHSDLIPF